MTVETLFSGGHLDAHLVDLQRDITQHLNAQGCESMLVTPEPETVARLAALVSLKCPRLDRDGARLLPVSEEPRRYHEFGEMQERRVAVYTLAVPIAGDGDVLRLRPSHEISPRPRGWIGPSELRLFSDGDRPAEQIRADFDRALDEVQQCLDWVQVDIDRHEHWLKTELPRLVAARRAKLLRDRDVQATIGFPLLRRDDADRYAVPIRQQTISLAQPSSQPASREPFLDSSHYEAALDVLRSARNALERTPSVAAGLGEEQIRDLILIFLNAQFKGAAAGEVFNRRGKTDILIRVDDGNVFVGECKFWDGSKKFTEAIDQLLGNLVWRDTKAALLLFIRAADVTQVTTKAIEAVQSHTNYKRRGKVSDDERTDFILHATGDPEREVQLALMPFLIPRKDS